MEMPKRVISILFIILIFTLVVSTFFPWKLGQKFFYKTFWFNGLWFLLAAGALCKAISLLKKREFTLAAVYSGIVIILSGGFLGGLGGVEGFMELKEGEKSNVLWVEDDLSQPLGFSVFLKDFSVDFYPEKHKGMRFIKGYKSDIAISKNGNTLKDGVIEVNHPLSFEGYNFYQYGYDEDYPNQTVLQVVKDPGLPLVYFGYLILLLGMVFSFKKIFIKV